MEQGRQLGTHIFHLVVFAVAGVALTWMMRRLGMGSMRELVHQVGWWFAVILGIEACSMACSAAALHVFMRPEARTVSYWRVLAAQASGVAINVLTPGGKLGEATKITMLVGHAPRGRVVSSVVLSNLFGIYLSVLTALIGVPATEMILPLPHRLAIVLWIATAVVAALALGLAVLVHRGVLASGLGAGTRLRLLSKERRDRWMKGLATIDAHLKEVQKNRTPSTRLGALFVIAARVLSWVEACVVLHAVGAELTVSLVVVTLSAGMVIDGVASVVPLGIGVSEGGNYALFDVLGEPPSIGVGAALVTRGRRAVMAVVGLVVMVAMHTANRISLARRRAMLERLRAEGQRAA
jgi:uncharacterized protein (TIRG00374 family)